jgi:hypothetical protein
MHLGGERNHRDASACAKRDATHKYRNEMRNEL